MARFIGRHILPPLALVVALVFPALGARAQARRYALDPAASRLTVHVGKSGLFGFAGHEHQVVSGTFHGSATFDSDRVAQSTVDLTFEAGALRVAAEGEPAGDAPQVQAAMVGPACLDVGRFPSVRFVSRDVAAAGGAGRDERDLDIRGDLTLHGVSHPLTVRVHVAIKGDVMEATGSTTIRQSDFGITPFSKAGVVKVKDALTIVWRVRGTAK